MRDVAPGQQDGQRILSALQDKQQWNSRHQQQSHVKYIRLACLFHRMVRQPAVYGGHHEGQVLHPGQLSDIRGVLLLLRRHINVPGVQHPRQGDGDSVELRGDPVPLRPSTDRLPPHPRASDWLPGPDVLQERLRRLPAGHQLHDRGQHSFRVTAGHPGPSQDEGGPVSLRHVLLMVCNVTGQSGLRRQWHHDAPLLLRLQSHAVPNTLLVVFHRHGPLPHIHNHCNTWLGTCSNLQPLVTTIILV